MEEQVAKALQKNIYEYVKEHFGQSEADDPSWCIEALAEELAKGNLKYEIYRAVEREFLREDCEMIADDNDIELSADEVELVVNEFMDCEAYVDAHAEDWLYWIKQIKKGE